MWQKLPKPIFILAPMEDVTDTVFRRIVASCARPDIFFTEFTSVDGLNSEGHKATVQRFEYTQEEHPLIAQIWGSTPELFYKAAQFIHAQGFDGIDINMGCPEKSVVQHKGGAACINDPIRAAEIIAATKEGSAGLPVSVKTRIGYKKIATEAWIGHLLTCDIDALTVHGRTAAELSKVPAHWDEIAKAVVLRNDMKKDTVIIGNGDVVNYADGLAKCVEYGVDGVMIGRGIFHDLWAFDKDGVSHMSNQKELFRIMREHIQLFDTTWGPTKNFAVLKKFFKIYVQGFAGASDVRVACMEAANAAEILSIVDRVEQELFS